MKRFALVALLTGIVALALSGCGPTYPNCDNDEHCKEHNEFCVNGACKQCAMDEHCNAMDKCLMCGHTGSCVTRSGCCHSDLDCPGGKCWKDGAEVGQCGGQCRGAGDCPEGMECRGGSCVAPPPPVVTSCAKDVYFDFNEYVLTSGAQKDLKANAACMKEQGQRYRIEGHCDERGTEEYNLALGERRARAAKTFMSDRGAGNNLSTISYGEEKPVCGGSTESCWSQNRRAEFTVE